MFSCNSLELPLYVRSFIAANVISMDQFTLFVCSPRCGILLYGVYERGIDRHKNGTPIKIAHIAVAGGAGAELLVRCSFVAYHIAVHIHGWNSFRWQSIACQIYLIRITWRSAISTNAKFNQKTRKFI